MDRLLPIAGVLLSLFHGSFGYDFYVGGKDGWVVKPHESYDLWAVNMRFQVNDKLVFKYKKGEDSVLQVKEKDFNLCNTSNPIKKFNNGDTIFLLDRSGPFYFISGEPGHCAQGQKLVVVVMAVRLPPSPSPSPAPAANSVSPLPSPTPSSAIGAAVSRVYCGVLALFLGAVVFG
ncbi:early nodulin-like protein 1 [Dendrobium catenatum]|uniref:Early nodulin-like protein 1 n=1 Tax=Dendrobium catenatum TaxID=906689 RepID=A0A2I0WWF8_9ASPA|nr:early nodulin-like protein 1 [Dendrobium catenatum]PKU79999.1 Early nodulin-like protein 1 [Dendrobium catenatum]